MTESYSLQSIEIKFDGHVIGPFHVHSIDFCDCKTFFIGTQSRFILHWSLFIQIILRAF